MNFLETTLQLIKENNISKNKMLTDLGLSKNSFVDWENRGTIPNGDTLIKIANYFNVSIDYLLGREKYFDSQAVSRARKRVALLYKQKDIPIHIIEKKLGVNYATFRSWYNGYGDYFNSIDGISKLADLFNVSVDYLIGRDGEYNSDGLQKVTITYAAEGEGSQTVQKEITPEVMEKINRLLEQD